MKKDRIVLTTLVVFAVMFLSLVLVLMKSPLWLAFPLAFAALGAVCYGVEGIIENKKLQRSERKA
ncbi:hypothetical protein [Levilactobacillus humaensis]|uniref:hypothetical protein n=1 Tax=Levilactobacillus humaensis TaxID=2950375 RepID=UPI0021C4C8E7|nr:hypothetical protein [Levilactobacillus humaensis]